MTQSQVFPLDVDAPISMRINPDGSFEVRCFQVAGRDTRVEMLLTFSAQAASEMAIAMTGLLQAGKIQPPAPDATPKH